MLCIRAARARHGLLLKGDSTEAQECLLAQIPVGVVVEIPFGEAAAPGGEAAAPGPAEVVGVLVDAVVPVTPDAFASAPATPSTE